MTDYRAYRDLRALIAALNPDVVHTHSSKAGIVGRWAAWDALRALRAAGPGGEGGAGAGPRVVHTVHGPPFMPVEGSTLQRAKTRFTNGVYTIAERSAAKRCHAIVSVADAMTRQFLARGIGEPSQFTTVYSGMETGPFLDAAPGEDRESVRAELGLSPGDFVVGTVARLAEHKGHDDLLDALSGDLRTHRHWKLLWVGDGWWRARLIERAKVLGLAVSEVDKLPTRARARAVTPSRAQLVLTGLVPPARIPGLVRAMDVLAHPSLREGLPRTVPQSLLAGVCPVAYDVDGTGEACREMQTGRLVKLGDRTGLRDAVRWMHDHPEERRRLAERGREECRVKFDAGTMVAELERVYAPSEQPAAVQPVPA
jgi:glycosyltransferase involved in cell wall biosynthesis